MYTSTLISCIGYMQHDPLNKNGNYHNICFKLNNSIFIVHTLRNVSYRPLKKFLYLNPSYDF